MFLGVGLQNVVSLVGAIAICAPKPTPTPKPDQGEMRVLVPKEAFGTVTLSKTYRFSLTVTGLL